MGETTNAFLTGVGWLPFSSNLRAASARLRCHNLVLQLARMGHGVEIAGERSVGDYRIVVLSKRYDHHALELARRVKQRGGATVLDLCDNHFDDAPGRPDGTERRQRLVQAIHEVDHVVVSTPALAEVVRTRVGYTGPLTVIGDPVEDLSLLRVPPGLRELAAFARLEPLRQRWLTERRHRDVRLVWFGTHGVSYADGGMLDLLDVRESLERLGRDHRLSLTVVSNNWRKYRRFIRRIGVPTRYFDWNPRTFVGLLKAHDVCVIPVILNAFTACKTNNRAATALWHGLPVVASGIPSYQELAPFVVLDNWDEGLRAYIEQPALVARHVCAGRQYLNVNYSLDAIARKWLDVFAQVTEQN